MYKTCKIFQHSKHIRTLYTVIYEGHSKSFATQYDAQMTQAKCNFYVIIQHNHLNTNAYVTFIKQLFDASQIEFLLHALQVRLRGLIDLVIIFEPCSCSAGCSNEHWISIAVTPTLLTRSGTQWLLCILSYEVVPRWQWDQAGHWVLSRIWTAGHHNSISLA